MGNQVWPRCPDRSEVELKSSGDALQNADGTSDAPKPTTLMEEDSLREAVMFHVRRDTRKIYHSPPLRVRRPQAQQLQVTRRQPRCTPGWWTGPPINRFYKMERSKMILEQMRAINLPSLSSKAFGVTLPWNGPSFRWYIEEIAVYQRVCLGYSCSWSGAGEEVLFAYRHPSGRRQH